MSVQTPSVFTERVNGLMKSRFITKTDMAERLNVDYSTFWRKLNGKRSVDMVLLKKIAEVLGTSVAYLMGETDNPTPGANETGEKASHIDGEKVSDESEDYSYWGGIINNAQRVARREDKGEMIFIASLLQRALASLNVQSVAVPA